MSIHLVYDLVSDVVSFVSVVVDVSVDSYIQPCIQCFARHDQFTKLSTTREEQIGSDMTGLTETGSLHSDIYNLLFSMKEV